MAESEYFDPDTGMIHLYKDQGVSNTSGASLDMTLGLTTFPHLSDVKVKVVSIEYKVKTFTDNLPLSGTGATADNNLHAFNNEDRQAGGTYLMGIKNYTDTSAINSLDDFQGSSAWPVHMTSWITQIGLPSSCTKTWKPRKVALSNEQVAFLTVRNNSGVINNKNSFSWMSIYMRLIRL